jgi:hypothetical protein
VLYGKTADQFIQPSLQVCTNVLIANPVLNFGSTAIGASADLSVSFTGVKSNDTAEVTWPAAANTNNTFYTAWVSNATVYVRFLNMGGATAIDPPSATFRVKVEQWR